MHFFTKNTTITLLGGASNTLWTLKMAHLSLEKEKTTGLHPGSADARVLAGGGEQ